MIEHQKNGLLVDFFDSKQLAVAVERLLQNSDFAKKLGENARATILERFELQHCVQRQLDLIHQVANPLVDEENKGAVLQP